MIEVPLEAYHNRAANNPVPWMIPAGVDEHTHGIREGALAAAAGQAFFADISEYQRRPYDASYPYPVASFRFHTGYRIDDLATANWAYLKSAIASRRVQVVFAYAVFIPGQLATVMAGLRAVFGATCPTVRLVLTIDMESSSNGFAGPGDHSVEANQWAQAFADYTGTSPDWRRSCGYANAGDWASNWPRRDPRLKQHKAAYTAKDPSPWAWQYAGGNPTYPVPAGYPRTCAPWSDRYIDMNVINASIDELEMQLGITEPAPVLHPQHHSEDPLLVMQLDPTTVPDGVPAGAVFTNEGGLHWVADSESLNAITGALVAQLDSNTTLTGYTGFAVVRTVSWAEIRRRAMEKYGPGGVGLFPTGVDFGAGHGIDNGDGSSWVPMPGTAPSPAPVPTPSGPLTLNVALTGTATSEGTS